MRRTLLAAVVLGMMIPAGLARADDPVSIGEVVSDPDAYHFRIVTLQGTVRQLSQLPPYSPTPDTTCYGAYTFVLENETGSIEISVLGICGKPLLRKPEVNDGEVILLAAQILSPNRLTSVSKGEVKKLRAVANSITHLSPIVPLSENSTSNRTEEPAKPEEGGKPVGESGY